MDSPLYPYKSIHNIKSLALLLGETVPLLNKLAEDSHKMYRRVPQVKKDGSERETFDAHEPLKSVQRKIVDRLLAKVSYPDYLHGGIRDSNYPRSIYSNVKSHSGARNLVLQDIKNFFPSITIDKVLSIFKGMMGFGDEVAVMLTRLVTKGGIVPQGASTSSYIANLVFWNVEPRLVVWIRALGMSYSRFADDISISSKNIILPDQKTEIVRRVTGMLAAKGFLQKRQKMHVLKKGQTITTAKKPEPVVVTGLSVAGPRPGVTKEERKKIRSAVREFEILAEAGADLIKLRELYNRAMGRVGRLLACGQSDGLALKNRLNLAMRQCNKPLLEKYEKGEVGGISI
ncbi:reverse transcriptase family protein [Pseudomonas sp. QTF5]|uniref:reverse transcriptase family protein n=1 Tax=Pseudomonas sp. QTF5 TaxID=1435425 RepID=UPI0004BE43E4|nr:reverse transcriptase family protein [Pseudomonas sp. QTF5]